MIGRKEVLRGAFGFLKKQCTYLRRLEISVVAPLHPAAWRYRLYSPFP